MRWATMIAALLAAASFAGCLGDAGGAATQDEPVEPTHAPDAASGPFEAASAAFEDGGEIPARYTCDGDNFSPPLEVTGIPPSAITLALVLYDPDAPVPGVGPFNFTHWLLWDASPTLAGTVTFPEDGTPPGAIEGENGGGGDGYTGPCPPLPLGPHRYVFTFYAVDTALELPAGATREELEAALEGHTLATTTLVGLYGEGPLGP